VKKTELSGKTVQELRALAKAAGLKSYSALKKTELVDLLAASGSGKTRSKPAAAKKVQAPKAAKRPAGAKKTQAPKAARKATSERVGDAESQVGRGLSPRTRRAFSIYRAPGEQRIKASKYHLGVQEAPDIDDGFMFPDTHGEDLIALMVRDPYWLFAYWEFSPDLNDRLLKRLGEEALRNSRLVLRVYDVTGADAENPVGYRRRPRRARLVHQCHARGERLLH